MPRVLGIRAKDLPSDFDALVRMHPPCAIHDEVAHGNTQEMIDALTRIPKTSAGQLRYLETLTILVAAYEDERHAIDASGIGVVDILHALMEKHGMHASALGRLLGEWSLQSKILTGARRPSKGHIRMLADHFSVSADLFF